MVLDQTRHVESSYLLSSITISHEETGVGGGEERGTRKKEQEGVKERMQLHVVKIYVTKVAVTHFFLVICT